MKFKEGSTDIHKAIRITVEELVEDDPKDIVAGLLYMLDCEVKASGDTWENFYFQMGIAENPYVKCLIDFYEEYRKRVIEILDSLRS